MLKIIRNIFMILPLITLKSGSDLSAQEWVKHTSKQDPSTISYIIGFDTCNLHSDLGKLYHYFTSQKTDSFIVDRMYEHFLEENTEYGKLIRKGKIKLPNFPATDIPKNLSWDENPLNNRTWAFIFIAFIR